MASFQPTPLDHIFPSSASINHDRTLSTQTTLSENQHRNEENAGIVGRSRRGTQSHQKLVFADPVAFRYLEEDPATIVLDRRKRLEGYELYVVEQWICSRVNPTFVICTYTGDPSHSVLVSILSVPVDESSWSPRLKIYFEALAQVHARRRETKYGSFMVTSLGSFASSLTVFPIPDGDVKKHKNDIVVNENLKRMGCSGRAAINIQPPQQSTIAKFYNLYRTSERVKISSSVLELVRLCQTALVLYEKLHPGYADGLLCDITEKAISDWWTDIGMYFFNVEPSEGALGPTTVAGLLGLMTGAYNRMKAYGAPVGKDVLDITAFKRAIGIFQKQQKIERTRRLDRETLDRLHRVTAKMASGEGWNMPKAVKSTVAELGGKGGEMVMGMVGARDKTGISDIETLDIERFSQLVVGAKMRWLWQGKPLKAAESFGGPTDDLNGRIFSTDADGKYIWTSQRQNSLFDEDLGRGEDIYGMHIPDSKTGLGRLRGAVGMRHHPRGTGEDLGESPEHVPQSATRPHLNTMKISPDHVLNRPTLSYPAGKDGPPLNLALAEAPARGFHHSQVQQARAVHSPDSFGKITDQLQPVESPEKKRIRVKMASLRKEIKGPMYADFSVQFEYGGPRSRTLRRSQSAIIMLPPYPDNPRQNRLSRQLSFGLIEHTLFGVDDYTVTREVRHPEGFKDPSAAMLAEEAASVDAQHRAKQILHLQRAVLPYTDNKVLQIENLFQASGEDLEELNNMYYQRLEKYQMLRATSSDIVAQEKAALSDGFRRVEMLGAKLDYELNALESRMQEVEDGIKDFERSVSDIESRLAELAGGEIQPQSVPWLQRVFNLFGRAPS